MTAVKPVRVAVVGAGLMGRRIAAAVHGHPELVLVAVVDLDQERARAIALEHGARVLPTIAAVAGLADAVYLGSPSTLHTSQCLEALALGLDVLVDKPMALDAADADRIGRAVQDSGRALMVGFSYRFRAEWRAAAQWVQEKRIGDVRLVSDVIVEAADRTPPWYGVVEAGGGVVQLQAHHCIDRIRWILAEPIEIVGAATQVREWAEAESHGAFLARGAGGAVITVALGFATGYSDLGTAQFLIHGSEGQIVIDSLARTATVSGIRGAARVEASEDDWLERELTAFAERCRGVAADDAGHPGWRDGHAAAEAVEQVLALAGSGAARASSRDRTKRAS